MQLEFAAAHDYLGRALRRGDVQVVGTIKTGRRSVKVWEWVKD